MKDDANHICLITKIRAMEGKLLNDIDYNNMHSMNTIREIYSYLSEHPKYTDILDDNDNISTIHRNQLEHLLIHSMYNDFIKIYKFCNCDERNFLKIIISRFEINILKRIIAHIGKTEPHKVTYANFFVKHSNIDFSTLQCATSIQDFANKLIGTPYYNLFQDLIKKGYKKLSDYETQLDIYYYKNIWNKRNNFNSDTNEFISYLIGTEMDLYNIKCIFRCKYFYNMSPNDIQNYIVPITYKLKNIKLKKLVESPTLDAFFEEFKTCYYRNTDITFDIKNIDDSFTRVLNEIHNRFIEKNPNSLARVYIYFDRKNYELHYTTKIIETIRYKNTHIQ